MNYTGEQRKPFGLACSRIRINFYKNKLYEAGIYYINGGEEAYKKLYPELVKRYGPSKELIIKISGQIEAEYWEYEEYKLYIQYYKDELVSVRYMYID